MDFKASVGDYLSSVSPVILVHPVANVCQVTVVVFISSEQVKPVKLGDRTELELSAFPPSKFGRLEAKVKSISPMPMSSSGLMKELRNDHLVERITEGGSPFMVKAEYPRIQKQVDLIGAHLRRLIGKFNKAWLAREV